MKRNKGFTLIELLVVIAIIGILSAILLSSLNQARSKAQDSKIQSQLAGMRSAAEIYFSSHNNKYGPPFHNSSPGAGCSDSVSLFGDVESGMQKLASSTPNIICGATDVGWVAAAPLVSDPALFWCVDSTGESRQVVNPVIVDSADPQCPSE